MDFKIASKKVQARKTKENFLVFTFGYDSKIVMPHKDGVALIACMANAEQLYDPYGGKHYIGEMEKTKIQISQMSQEEYERYKIAALLDISLDEVKQHQLQDT
jgi:hypothetical protein